MEFSIIKIVLSSIKSYCKNRGDEGDVCANCPFSIKHKWVEMCMFCGPHVGEGVIPENWELDEVDFKDDIN